jgi:hypothetical protein
LFGHLWVKYQAIVIIAAPIPQVQLILSGIPEKNVPAPDILVSGSLKAEASLCNLRVVSGSAVLHLILALALSSFTCLLLDCAYTFWLGC